jgi:hypothetical protein
MPLRGRRRRNPSSSFATEESTRERRSCATSISKQPMPGPTPRAFVRRLKGHRSASAACLTVSPTFPILTHGWFIYVACSRQVPPRRLNHSAPENRKGFICQYKNSLLGRLAASEPRLPSLIDERGAQRATGLQQASANSSERMHITRSGSCPSCAARSVFTCHYQGVSHAECPKDKHECAPTQAGSAICWPLKAVVIECRPPRTERLSQCAKKL